MRKRLLTLVVATVIALLAFGSAALAKDGTGAHPDADLMFTMSAQDEPDAQPVADGTYLIQSKLSKWQVLDISNASKADGANAQIWRSNMTNAQRWYLAYDSETGFYSIQNVASKKYLDVAGASKKSGTNVQQWAGNGSMAQRWKIVKNPDGSFTVTSALNGKLALGIAGSGKANGTNVQVETSKASTSQKWSLLSTNVTVAPGENLGLKGWYAISPSSADGFALDVANGSTASGANVQAYTKNSTLAQLYSFEYKNGFYRIVNARSQKALMAEAGNLVSGTNVVMGSGSGKSALFAAKKRSDGTVTFINKANGMALALSGTAKNGANIVTTTSNGKAAQRFKLTKVKNLVPTGISTVRPVYTGRVLDVANGSTADGANVQIYDGNGSFAQKWQVARTATNTYRFRSLVSGKYLGLAGNNVVTRSKATDGSQEWVASIKNGGYVFKNKKTGKVLDMESAGSGNGTNVQTYEGNGSKAQSFLVTATAPVSDGTYFINSALGSSKVLDVSGGSKANGANVQLYAKNGSGAQMWNLTRNSDGTYTIVNAQSGKALEVANGSAKSGANVQQYAKNGTKAQRWSIGYSGRFVLTSALDPTLVLDVAGASATNGANVDIATKAGGKSQGWTFTPTVYNPIPAEQKAMMSRAQGYSSSTQWLILVDCTTNRTCIFKGSKGNWEVEYFWICSTGAYDSPTVKGEFTIYDRYGSFGEHYTCWWPTRFYGPYLFHSVLYEPGSDTVIQDGRLGQNVSQGCVRLPIEKAKWIHDNIPDGTKVVVY